MKLQLKNRELNDLVFAAAYLCESEPSLRYTYEEIFRKQPDSALLSLFLHMLATSPHNRLSNNKYPKVSRRIRVS